MGRFQMGSLHTWWQMLYFPWCLPFLTGSVSKPSNKEARPFTVSFNYVSVILDNSHSAPPNRTVRKDVWLIWGKHLRCHRKQNRYSPQVVLGKLIQDHRVTEVGPYWINLETVSLPNWFRSLDWGWRGYGELDLRTKLAPLFRYQD